MAWWKLGSKGSTFGRRSAAHPVSPARRETGGRSIRRRSAIDRHRRHRTSRRGRDCRGSARKDFNASATSVIAIVLLFTSIALAEVIELGLQTREAIEILVALLAELFYLRVGRSGGCLRFFAFGGQFVVDVEWCGGRRLLRWISSSSFSCLLIPNHSRYGRRAAQCTRPPKSCARSRYGWARSRPENP